MKKKLSLLLAGAMALSLTACGGGTQPSANSQAPSNNGEKVVRIGVFEPSTGDSGPGGKQEMLGMQYANQEDRKSVV